MKKQRFLLLLLILPAISVLLASCKVSKISDPGSSTAAPSSQSASSGEKSTTLSSQRAQRVANDIEKGRFDNFDSYSDEEKEIIKKSVEDDGYTLEYNPDGSATLSNEEGSWFIGTGWTENEYTKGIPKPDFGTVTMSAEDEDGGEKFYIFLIKNASAEQVADYTGKLKEAGYTPSPESVIDIENGIISFDGKNSAGRSISIGYTVRTGMTVKLCK